MRSRSERTLGLLAIAVGVGFATTAGLACTEDKSMTCSDPQLTYATFGEPFMLDWCLSCHSSELPAGMRQNAPLDINFNTLQEIRVQSLTVGMSVAQNTMPPEGGPSDGDRELLAEWLACGAP